MATRWQVVLVERRTIIEVTQDTAAMLPSGDFEKLGKHEREEFHAMQERMIQLLVKESNHFQSRFPGLHVEWKFQAEVYMNPQAKPSTIRYSNKLY